MQSDLFIPRLSDILDRACESLGSAYRLQDDASARQLERLIKNLPGATLCWQLGTLIVFSPSGSQYRVTRAGCSCPNGTKSHSRQCWHVATFELLLDMFETDCDTADMEAEREQETGDRQQSLDCDSGTVPCDLSPVPSTPWYARAASVRRSCYASL